MPDEKLSREVNAVDAQAKQRFGEEQWATAIDALGKAAGPAGIPEDAMRQILQQPDPAGVLMNAGKEALLQRSDAGDTQAEYEFARIRQAEREQYRKLRGR
jgi:hypothetical protein